MCTEDGGLLLYGEITIRLSEAEVCLGIAEYFQLNALKTKIEEFVCKQLSFENSIGWYFLADKFNLDTLKNQSRSVMISDFKDVVKHIEFHQLTLTELEEYIQQVVIITDGDVVLDACFNWVNYNVESTSELFLNILKHLRLDQCSQACKERVRNFSWHPVWPNNAEIQKVLDVHCLNTATTPIAGAASKKLTAPIVGALSTTLTAPIEGVDAKELTEPIAGADSTKLSMVKSNFKDVVKCIDFHQLILAKLIDYIQQVVIVTDGDVVLDACFNWVNYNVESRSESFLDILKHHRLDRCSQACIERVCKSWHPVWPNFAEIQKVFDVQCSNSPTTPIAGAASKKLVILLLGGYTETNVLNRNIWKINVASGQCDQIGQMAHYASTYCATYCATPRGLFVMGGSYANGVGTALIKDVSLLTLPNMQWKQWSKSVKPASLSVAVCIKNHMYIFDLTGVWCLNLNTKVWSACPDMPAKNTAPIIAAMREKVYMIFNAAPFSEKYRKSTDTPMCCFDTSTHSWSDLRPLSDSLKNTAYAKAVTDGEELFLMGGEDRLCAKYSPRTIKWTLLKRPRLVHHIFSVVHLEGQIILFGGRDSETHHKNIDVYDIAKNSCELHQLQMPVALACHHCAVYDETAGEFVIQSKCYHKQSTMKTMIQLHDNQEGVIG